MMTILFFKDAEISPCLGGIARINYNLSDSLAKLGHRTLFLAAKKKYGVEEEKNQLYLPDSTRINSEQNVDYLHNLILEEGIGVIINSLFEPSATLFLNSSKRNTNARIITWIHNNVIEYASLVGYCKESILKQNHLSLLYGLLTTRLAISFLRILGKRKHQKTARLIYKLSDKIVVVCNGNIKEFITLLGFNDKSDKLTAISNFIPTEINECSLDIKENRVVWCGSVNSSIKKTNWMLEIWKGVEQCVDEWELTIIGDSSELCSMKEYSKFLGLKRVTFTGRVSPTDYYRRASILCSTSITESFGLTIIEGMQQKAVPVAFASSPSIVEIVKNNGILIRPFNKKEFEEGLITLMRSPERRKELAEDCYISSRHFEENSVLNAWQALINKQ